MASHEELRARAASTYNAASDSYDSSDNAFWERFGRRTVARLGLQSGMRVLDVCSGSGASAIPAAEMVGPTGQVVAVDIAEDLLTLLRKKATDRRLRQLKAQTGDLFDLDRLNETFDAVVCVFGIFFLADMVDGIRKLWQRTSSGGQLAITTWGPRLFEPVNARFWEAIGRERADLVKQFNPWDIITTPDTLRPLLASAGIENGEIVAESAYHPLGSPSAWWALVMGSGYRGTVEQLTVSARERVREDNCRFVADANISAVETNVLYAVARKGFNHE
jgi:SAM-dependent methyltransferase